MREQEKVKMKKETRWMKKDKRMKVEKRSR